MTGGGGRRGTLGPPRPLPGHGVWAMVATVAVAAGCGKAGTTPGTTPAPGCDDVHAALVGELVREAALAPAPERARAEELAGAVADAVRAACAADAWSSEGRTCFIAGALTAGERCAGPLTPAQLEGMDRRVDEQVAEVAPATCAELPAVVRAALVDDLAALPDDQRATATAAVDGFADEVARRCEGDGWSTVARTCLRDATANRADAGRCVRWMDAAQRAAYQRAVEQAFGAPPAAATPAPEAAPTP